MSIHETVDSFINRAYAAGNYFGAILMTVQLANPQFSEVPGRPTWSFGPLYDFVWKCLPTYRTSRNIVDVPELADAMGLSKEAIYKWFRSGNLTAPNARKLQELSSESRNLELLKQSDIQPPAITDFYEFVK